MGLASVAAAYCLGACHPAPARRARQRGSGRARGAGRIVALSPENPRSFTPVDTGQGSFVQAPAGFMMRSTGVPFGPLTSGKKT